MANLQRVYGRIMDHAIGLDRTDEEREADESEWRNASLCPPTEPTDDMDQRQ